MKKRHTLRWILLAVFAGAIVWIAFGEGSCAQGFRAVLGRKPDQPVLNSSFQLYPRGFRYYKFNLPEGSRNMALVGHFSAASVPAGHPDAGQQSPSNSEPGVEVLIIPEASFENWQHGNGVSLVYNSGKVSEQQVNQKLPDGAGVYFMVFSNRSDRVASKKITANFSLHSNRWLSY